MAELGGKRIFIVSRSEAQFAARNAYSWPALDFPHLYSPKWIVLEIGDCWAIVERTFQRGKRPAHEQAVRTSKQTGEQHCPLAILAVLVAEESDQIPFFQPNSHKL